MKIMNVNLNKPRTTSWFLSGVGIPTPTFTPRAVGVLSTTITRLTSEEPAVEAINEGVPAPRLPR